MTHGVYKLADMAGAASPDSKTSPGAEFLTGVAESFQEAVDNGWFDEDSVHEIADGAVPVYTHEMWKTFVDLAAWQEDVEHDDLDMTAQAGMALYQIAQRLVEALAAEREEEE